MNSTCCTLLIVLALQCRECPAGDLLYYREFLSATSGKSTPFRVTTTALVDTSNCSPVGAKPISLAPGVIAGGRLGMSMDEIVSLWGKPSSAGLSCTARPTFSYGDLWLDFKENQVYSITMNLWKPFTPQFAGGLVPLSPTGEWVRLLGQPKHQFTNNWGVSLCYETNQTVTRLQFDPRDKQLSEIKLTRSVCTNNKEVK
jgi:hypothetical protein